jgi:hypothetical protein
MMMTSVTQSILLLLLLFPMGTEAFLLDQLLNLLFQPILSGGCTAITNLIGNVGNFNCACTGNFALAQLGFNAGVNCKTKTNAPICLAPSAPDVCGTFCFCLFVYDSIEVSTRTKRFAGCAR